MYNLNQGQAKLSTSSVMTLQVLFRYSKILCTLTTIHLGFTSATSPPASPLVLLPLFAPQG